MADTNRNPAPRPVYRWPRFLLAAVLLGVALAILWMTVEVRRIRQRREWYEFPPGSTPPTSPTNTPAPGARAENTPPDPLAGFREALQGGDADAGRKIFFDRPEANCAKCHRVAGQGGDLGPALDGVGSRRTREYLLDAVLSPNAHPLDGYENLIVLLKSGRGYAGLLKSESETNLVLRTTDDGLVTITKSDIQSRQKGKSPMPEGLGQALSQRDLQNLIAFLSSLT
jgi:putative heme-binding domain-containing protein